jgi:hypothetical protein
MTHWEKQDPSTVSIDLYSVFVGSSSLLLYLTIFVVIDHGTI